MIRIGFGFDTHRLEEGHAFILGGIRLSWSKGATGHSDADVLIHAIGDALLGAAGLSDIGHHFPDTSAELKGIDSKILLKKILSLIRAEGYSIVNIDTTIVLQRPKIEKSIPDMIRVLSEVLEIGPGQLSIKAKTSENLGFIGREEGISAYAVSLLEK